MLGVRAALWADRPDAADELLETLKSGQPKGRAIQAAIRSLDGGLAARRGRPKLAAARYRSAFRAWQQLDLPLPHALGLIERDGFLPAEADPGETSAALQRLGAAGLQALTRRAARGTRSRAVE